MNTTVKPVNSTEPKSSKSRPRQVVAILVIAVTLGVFVVGGRWLAYRSTHLVVGDAVIKGTITRLGARLDGQVKSIFATPGQRVRKGEIVVQLEDQHLQAALLRAQAECESATNELHCEKLAIEEERRRLPTEVEKAESLLKSAVASFEGAQARANRLSSEVDRIAALKKAEMASASDLELVASERDKAQAEVRAASGLKEAAQSSLQTARLQMEALRVREARLGVLQSLVSVARAKMAVAEADLEATRLRAPDDGWLVERIVEVGGSAKVGEPMVSLWIGRPWVEAWASEKELGRMQLGGKARISLDAFPRQPLPGRIEAFGLLTDKELLDRPVPSSLDSLIRKGAMVRVRIALEDDSLRLQPGLTAIVGIEKTPQRSFPEQPVILGQAQPASKRFAAQSAGSEKSNQQN